MRGAKGGPRVTLGTPSGPKEAAGSPEDFPFSLSWTYGKAQEGMLPLPQWYYQDPWTLLSKTDLNPHTPTSPSKTDLNL